MFEFVRQLSLDTTLGTATGTAFVDTSQPLFNDHFPGYPILPGSILIEICAQIAGLLAEETANKKFSTEYWAILGLIRNARFLQPITLPATIEISAKIVKSDRTNVSVRVVASQNSKPKMRTELVMMLLQDVPRNEAAVAARNLRLAEWSKGM